MTSKGKTASWAGQAWPGAEVWGDDNVPFFQANRRALEHWMKINETVAGGLFELSQEMMRFAQSRFREDVETNVALARCRTPSDALDCQRRFTERATAQYIEAANKLADVMTKTAREGLVSMSAAANEGAQPQRAAKA